MIITAIREIQILQKLKNDHIVQLKDCFISGCIEMNNRSSVVDSQSQYPDLYMVMEYISLETISYVIYSIIYRYIIGYSVMQLLLSLTLSVIMTC